MGADSDSDDATTPPETKAKSYRHYLPNIAEAKALSLDKAMTEAIVSLNLLKSEIMDGNERKLSEIFSNSLPLVTKDHLFDGLNTNFIQQDILSAAKKPKTTAFKVRETSAKKDRDRFKTGNTRSQRYDSYSEHVAATPKLTKAMDKETYRRKFRDFEKDQQFKAAFMQLRRYQTPIRTPSKCQPRSYNKFITRGVEGEDGTAATAPSLIVSSVKLGESKEAERDFVPVAGLPLLQIQIERVKELVGQRQKPSLRHEGAKNAERKLTSRRSRVCVTGSELIERWDREGRALFPPTSPPKSRWSDYSSSSRPLTTPWDQLPRMSPRVKHILSPSNLIF